MTDVRAGASLIDWFLADSLSRGLQVIHSEEGGRIYKYISEQAVKKRNEKKNILKNLQKTFVPLSLFSSTAACRNRWSGVVIPTRIVNN